MYLLQLYDLDGEDLKMAQAVLIYAAGRGGICINYDHRSTMATEEDQLIRYILP